MMENTKKCLIVGLPNAGKSTYIGAFWAIEKDGGTGHKLVKNILLIPLTWML